MNDRVKRMLSYLKYGNKKDLTALIQYRDKFYRASTLEELETIVQDLKNKRNE